MMDRYLTIQQSTVTKDAMGGQIQTWADYDQVWASKYDKTVRDAIEGGREVSRTFTMFKFRYDPDKIPNAGMRIVEGSDTYDIEGLKEFGRREYWEAKCSRRY